MSDYAGDTDRAVRFSYDAWFTPIGGRVLYTRLRRALFRLDPELAHAATLRLLQVAGASAPLRALLRRSVATPPSAPVEAFGLSFPNPVGLAAGYDKDGLAWRGLACLGFGHVELGTVTPLPQPGNPRPRVFRLVEDRSLINRLGFPSRGAAFVARRLSGRRPKGLVVGVNIGKQGTTALEGAAADYALLIERFAPLADYLAVNVSSPNTPELRRLQQRRWLEPLLAAVVSRRDASAAGIGRPVPVLVKLSPDLDSGQLDEALDAIVSAGVDGVIATNTTIARPSLRSDRAGESGGLSGAALADLSSSMVREIHRRTDGRLPVVACGGVMDPEGAREKLEAGACLVQLYTGLVYEGPRLVRRLLAASLPPAEFPRGL